MVSDTTALFTPAEVAGLFRVCVPTVTKWANTGKLTAIRTLGGHRRYPGTEVLGLLAADVPAQIKAVELVFPGWRVWRTDMGVQASCDTRRCVIRAADLTQIRAAIAAQITEWENQ